MVSGSYFGGCWAHGGIGLLGGAAAFRILIFCITICQRFQGLVHCLTLA